MAVNVSIQNLKSELDGSSGRKIFAEFLDNNFEDGAALLKKFDLLTEIYLQVLSVMNISAIKDVDGIYIKHYLDSIYPYKHFGGSCCDVGCGGGFPTIPLAIVTGLNITGVDSVGKKLLLIKRCESELQLKNLKSEYARSEDLVKLHRKYDTVCARAVADVDKTLSYLAPLCVDGGKIIMYKTQNDEPAKQSSLNKYKVTLLEEIDYTLPSTDIRRRLFVYKKLPTSI